MIFAHPHPSRREIRFTGLPRTDRVLHLEEDHRWPYADHLTDAQMAAAHVETHKGDPDADVG